MGVKIFSEAFTFDDVLIRPSRSSIEPREASLRASLASGFGLSLPFLSAAMDRVTGARMAIALHTAGGLGILHRNCTIATQEEMMREVKRARARVGAACGPFDVERALALKKAGVDVL
ncbi:MAG: IMP dehydrogenase, partial [Minisyncoccia bacterium]